MKSTTKDRSGIDYISMIVLQLKNTTIPWNSLLNTNTIMFVTNLIKKIDIILERKDVQLLYTKRENYNTTDNNVNIQNPNHIQKWIYMLPPVISFSVVEKLNIITEDLETNSDPKLIQIATGSPRSKSVV